MCYGKQIVRKYFLGGGVGSGGGIRITMLMLDLRGCSFVQGNVRNRHPGFR